MKLGFYILFLVVKFNQLLSEIFVFQTQCFVTGLVKDISHFVIFSRYF